MKNRSGKIVGVILAVAGLAACAPEFNPPPGYQGGFLMDTDTSRTITVQPGDTVFTLARRYNVPSQVIIARNGLAAPFALTTGQTLILDPTRSHTVVRGDTLSQLAVTYNVEMRLIASANDLKAPYVIRIGQELWIPDPFTIAAAPVTGETSVAELPPPRALDARDLNDGGLPPPVAAPTRVPRSAITEESLAPPPGAPAQPSTVFGAPPPPEAPAAAPVVQELGPPATEGEKEVAVVLPLPQPISEPPARASSRFSWPLNGKIIAGYGSAGKGLHNDGINIAAPVGTQVRAADNGVVAYAGNELKGFGNLLLIKHADGWTTAYAHNDKLLVKRGDEVKQGQVVAVVGRTGNVDSPQLHFEVRKGTQAMDPMEFLSK